MELTGTTAIITGSGSGVGRALALEFARHGANVVCAARREDRLRETVRLIEAEGGQALAVPTDVTDAAQVDRLVAQALDRFGSIDVLFNNAGSFATLGAVWEVDPQQWWHDVTVNLLGPMLCCRAVLPHMIERNRGIVINMSGGNQIPGGTGYSCSKVAVVRLTELLAKELERKETNVLAFGMGPGFVRTEMTEPQITTPEGQFWLPSSKDAVDQGRDRSPQDCARKTIELIRAARPAFNGRIFGVNTDFDAEIAALDAKPA